MKLFVTLFSVITVLFVATNLLAEDSISPAAIIRHFFDAYNRHDVEAIEASFGADAKLFASGKNVPLLEGRNAFGGFFRNRFEKNSETKAEIKALYEYKNIVIVHEEASSSKNPEARPVLDIFKVQDGVIRSVWAFEPRTAAADAAAIVQQQVDYYNKKDLDGFLSTYSRDAALFDLRTGKVLAEGNEALTARYKERFETSPELHAEIVHRISAGNIVVDHERVVMGPESKIRNAIAVYDVDGSLIKTVWFLMMD